MKGCTLKGVWSAGVAHPVVVCGCGVLVTGNHLRSHPGPGGRASHPRVHTSCEDSGSPIGRPNEGVALADGAVQLSGHTEVDQFDVSVVSEEYVLPLDVPVDHLAFVQVTQALGVGQGRQTGR